MGDGAFSNVYKAVERATGRKVAVKVVRKFELNSTQVRTRPRSPPLYIVSLFAASCVLATHRIKVARDLFFPSFCFSSFILSLPPLSSPVFDHDNN